MDQPPQHQPGGLHRAPGESDILQNVIPYKNTPALIGYYLSVFSLIPCLGLLLGPAALILGTMGWKQALSQPESKGRAHALVAMILGGLVFLAHIGVIGYLLLQAGLTNAGRTRY